MQLTIYLSVYLKQMFKMKLLNNQNFGVKKQFRLLYFNYQYLTPLFCAKHLRKATIDVLVFDAARSLNLSVGVLCVGPQPAACEDRGPAVIETCYRSTAEHKERSIQTVRGYTSVCRSDGELSSAIHTQQARKTSRLKRCTKNMHVLLLWRTDKNCWKLERIVSGWCERDVFIWKMFKVCEENTLVLKVNSLQKTATKTQYNMRRKIYGT